MRGPSLPTAEDLGDLARLWPIGAVWASTWIVTNTAIPAALQDVVAILLVVVPIAATVVVVQLTSYELTGGRCRAETADGSRCQLHRPPNTDLCRAVHQRCYDVDLHESALEEIEFRA